MKLSNLTVLLLASLGFSSVASAHAIWVAQVHGEQAISYGHAGTDSDEYSADKITKAYGYKTDGSKVDVQVVKKDTHAALEFDKLGIVAAQMDNGYWAQDKDGNWINKRGDQVEGAKSSSHGFKETVAYLNPRIKPVATGMTLEIIPEVNPATLKKGDNLKVQVVFNGKPVEGIEVDSNYFAGDAATVKTDKDGYATVPVAEQAFNIIEAGYKVKAADPFDNQSYATTLTFEAKHEHHH